MGLRYGSKVDTNQAQIVRELRAMGFRVDLVHRLKKLYDMVVTGNKKIQYQTGLHPIFKEEVSTLRVEVKKEGEGLTVDEKEYWDSEPYPETLIIATSTEDVLKWFGRI